MDGKPLVAITGASSGIGEAAARAFSAAGHPVLLMARRLERMQALGLPNAICAKVDVRDRDELVAAVRGAEAKFGPVDMMFVNAGIARLADIGRQPSRGMGRDDRHQRKGRDEQRSTPSCPA
jgi:NADP-dependent 3-hydroxy acid dehydrogenase YdfG